MKEVRFVRLSGSDIIPYIPDLAKLRIAIFREFPYLYDGSVAYEERYLKRYTLSDRSVVVLALDGHAIVGASTGMPLEDEDAPVRKPFEEGGFDLSGIFYFGESVLLKEYRGLGIGVRFFEERESHARKLGYSITTFCAVNRPDDHPRRPSGYTPLNQFWEKRGYAVRPDLKASFTWQDLDEAAESPKSMTFWLKHHL